MKKKDKKKPKSNKVAAKKGAPKKLVAKGKVAPKLKIEAKKAAKKPAILPPKALKGKATSLSKEGASKKGESAPGALAKSSGALPEKEVILTNADGKQYCRVHDCDSESTTEGYCRYHYLALWKRNRTKAKILQGGKLDKYIEDLTAKYPDKYLEMLRKDLASEKDFNLIVAEMDVEDSGEEAENEEDTSRFIEEVRGGIPTPDDDEGGF